MLKDYQNKLLELWEQLELEISNLYRLFAQKFPAHSQLWNALSSDELNHAAYVKEMFSLAEAGKVFFNEKTTKTYTIKTINDDIKTVYKKTEAGQYTIINALAYSVNLEDSIIEKKFYDYFSTNDRDINLLINKIKQETIEHSQRVKKALEEEKLR
ncbi:MAG: hypothetical protein WBK44_04050 [Smithellaceae bacterium]